MTDPTPALTREEIAKLVERSSDYANLWSDGTVGIMPYELRGLCQMAETSLAQAERIAELEHDQRRLLREAMEAQTKLEQSQAREDRSRSISKGAGEQTAWFHSKLMDAERALATANARIAELEQAILPDITARLAKGETWDKDLLALAAAHREDSETVDTCDVGDAYGSHIEIPRLIGIKRRAEQAEAALATVTAERDAARKAHSDSFGALATISAGCLDGEVDDYAALADRVVRMMKGDLAQLARLTPVVEAAKVAVSALHREYAYLREKVGELEIALQRAAETPKG